jgi:hypothetical protein
MDPLLTQEAVMRIVLLPIIAAAVLAGCEAGVEGFEGHLAVNQFSMLPADPVAPTSGSSRFDGRCSVPSSWIATFEMEGSLPHLGHVWGSASHCSQVTEVTERGPAVTYTDGRAWLRTATGEDILLDYGDGVGLVPDSTGVQVWWDRWTLRGGTGRFAEATGSGIDSGSVVVATMHLPPYLMKGTLRNVSARAPRLNLRGWIDGRWTAPYLAGGRAAEDPCVASHGPGWMTNAITGEGEATRLGGFTLEGSYCSGPQATVAEGRRFIATTNDGDTFEVLELEREMDLPGFVPGLDREYLYRTHHRLTGLTGALQGVVGEFWSAGRIDGHWQNMGGQPMPIQPWTLAADIAGWLEPAPPTR